MQKARRHLKAVVIIGLSLVIGGYAFMASKSLIEGPTIDIESPENGEATTTSFISISGRVKNIAFISLNDRQIFVDEDGNLYEQLLLAKGYNILSLKGKDKFGTETIKRLELIYQ